MTLLITLFILWYIVGVIGYAYVLWLFEDVTLILMMFVLFIGVFGPILLVLALMAQKIKWMNFVLMAKRPTTKSK